MARAPTLLAEEVDVGFLLFRVLGLLVFLDHGVNDLHLVWRYAERLQSTFREVAEARVDKALSNRERHVEVVSVVRSEVGREGRSGDSVLVTQKIDLFLQFISVLDVHAVEDGREHVVEEVAIGQDELKIG